MRSAYAARLRPTPTPRAEQLPLPRLTPSSSAPNPAAYYADLLASLARDCHARHPFDASPRGADPWRAGWILHARILRLGLPLGGRLGDALVDLYARSGRAGYAWRALGSLGPRASGAAASSVLSHHARSDSPRDVLDAFRRVKSAAAGGRPDQFGLAIVLSACSRLGVLDYGRQVHCDVLKTGFGSSAFCQAALVDTYAKCGEVADARRMFDGIACPDTICWTSMIAGFHRVGHHHQALALFSRMEKVGSVPDQVTCVTIISALASMGRLEDARTMLKRVHMPSTVAWNAVISSYAQSGLESEVFSLYKDMRNQGLRPTRSTFASVISATANKAAFDEGRQVHAAAVRHGLDANVFVGSSLINLYVKNGCIAGAKKVFHFSSEKNIVMWNAMLNGFVQNDLEEETIQMFQYMRRIDLEADDFTFVSVLGACINLDSLGLGRQVHCITIKNRMDANLFVANATLDMYSKLGAIDIAKELFSLIPNKDSVSWNALIVGLAHNEEEEEAVCMLKRMMLHGITPDEVSFATAINACSNIQATETGKQVHCASIKYNICSNHAVGSSLIDLYSKHGDLESSRKILAQVDASSIVPRNALITGLVQNNKEDEAIELFQQVLKDGFRPSSFTFASILSSCTGLASSVIGKQVHCYTLKSGLLNVDSSLGIALIGIYLKCKMLEYANKLLMEMPDQKNLVEWTAIISGYAQNGYSDHSLLSYWRMRTYDVRSDEATFASVLKACSEMAALTDGQEIHGLIIKSGFGSYEIASSALIDMYSKCGDVTSSFEIFNELKSKKDIMLWNSMIVGFAKNGYASEALFLFQKMQESQLKPDEVTFLGVLIACSHAGLISEGRNFFDSMSKVYGLIPRVDHYACFIDLLGRGGHLEEAQEVIDKLPFEADGVIWATFLAACRMHKDEEKGKIAAKKLIKLEPQSSSTYVFLSNLHAATGNWVEAKVTRETMREKGVTKFPGCSWITVGNKTNVFVVQDKDHPDTTSIYEMLGHITRMIEKDNNIEEYGQHISSVLLA